MAGRGGRGRGEEEVVVGEGEEVEEEEVVEEEECKGRIYHWLCRTCSQQRFLFGKYDSTTLWQSLSNKEWLKAKEQSK